MRLRRLRMGLATVLGIAPRGFFIPYRNAELGAAERRRHARIEAAFAALGEDFAAFVDLLDRYRGDLLAIAAEAAPPAPRWGQDWFPGLDAAALYAMVRRHRPRRIVEIGCGHSTRFLARAVADGGIECEVTAIDPDPRAALDGLPVRHLRRPVQEVDPAAFAEMAAGDMLIVDSSHVLMPGSDVDVILNDILPSLAEGVLVHVHDRLPARSLPGRVALARLQRAGRAGAPGRRRRALPAPVREPLRAPHAGRAAGALGGRRAAAPGRGDRIQPLAEEGRGRCAPRPRRGPREAPMIPMLRSALGGSDREPVPPARVRDAIDRQRHQSEKLIGWVQLAVVGTFAALYAASPKTFAADVMFEPVPWALAAYLAFTLMRMASSRRGPLPQWLVALSVVADMALLFGLIWSFHLQYGQPAAFYLKAPTLLYVFIFIALRALRFEARFVVLAGLAAAAGWLLLVAYAVLLDPGGDAITRDYVAYMTSAQVLLGAEFDKVVSILVVTLILAVAIVRARRLLVRSATEGAAAEDLSRFFAPEVADQITPIRAAHRAGPGRAGRRGGAVLRHPRLHAPLPRAGARRPDDPAGRIRSPHGRCHSRSRRQHRQVSGRRHHGDVRRRDPLEELGRRCHERGRRAGGRGRGVAGRAPRRGRAAARDRLRGRHRAGDLRRRGRPAAPRVHGDRRCRKTSPPSSRSTTRPWAPSPSPRRGPTRRRARKATRRPPAAGCSRGPRSPGSSSR